MKDSPDYLDCRECGEPTGRPGLDDSLFIDNDGPYCTKCYGQKIEDEGTTMSETAERSLDQLVEDMTKECGLLPELQAAQREAGLRVTSCHHTINDLQKKIDNRVKKMSEDAIHESYWGQKVRDTQ